MLDYIRSLITLIFAISFMYMLLDCDFKNKRKRYLLILFGVVVIICDIFVIYNFGYAYFMKLYPFLVHIPSLLIFLSASKFKPIKVLFVHFTLNAIVISVSMIGIIISGLLGSTKTLYNIICYIIYVPLIYIFFRYIRPAFLYLLHNIEKGWFGFCVIPISYMAIIFIASSYNVDAVIIEPKSIIMTLLMLISTTSAYYLIFRNFRQIREQLTLQNEQNLLRTQIAAAKTHMEDLKESQEKTIIYRHDMRHHLNLISAFLVDNNTAATQKYIAEVQKNIDDTVIEQYCNNYTVNLILSFYLQKAKQEHITIETQINLPDKNKVSDTDLCIIFANAIENAINACSQISDITVRSLKIICKNKNDKLFIQITNSYEGTLQFVDDMPISTEKNHGFGTKSIAAVIQKNHGVYSFSADHNIFQSVFIL